MNLDDRLSQIQSRLAPLRDALLDHPIYGQINNIENLRVFMQHHIFAVWDFMSLLKALQQRLCSSNTPWLPSNNRIAVRFVNEIVLGEESDEDGQGEYASHFDLYYRAMERSGASMQTIDQFIATLRLHGSVDDAMMQCEVPRCVQKFVHHTFEVIASNNLLAIASAFTFGREDLLPDVFQRVVDELNVAEGGSLDDFNFYLSRHIELDGDHHGPMAARMIGTLCGDDDFKWRTTEEAAIRSLEARKAFWDGIHDTMLAKHRAAPVPPPHMQPTRRSPHMR